ncbi:isocitrate dehydrogenase [Saccharolobus solfataricus]|uniref:Isocitrate dehydrogenase n=2 Tax=Saccharolobus solfataricus TaxID=2287 RepID=A0A0E3GU68_SACSO|nr:isocitrate dehydrogenase [Saccharolobus solfataricus]AKA77740.1 isocitrate dehydrogenase [Saccharolobus solfataricus]AKA80433.1 isocitrate dehydrogenase [Saccharolobus solfataricus]AZF69497.1 isocitrate dehydrogenase [Saccharolobus solfataricus]AZF72117.1 isocitrate dehydrogenase [Saccharolobus solfataricus]
MVCEFLPRKFKQQLVEMADDEDLVEVGFKKKTIYALREGRFIISDEKCEKLVGVLAMKRKEKLVDVLNTALNEFRREIEKII